MTARTLAAAALLALASSATAHADNRDYVDSGAYLADVTAATAPATAWLLARTDAIARQAELCRAAGYPLQGTTGGATARVARVRRTATPAAAAPYGAVTLTVDRVSPLSRSRVAVKAVAPAKGSAKAYTFPVARGTIAAGRATVWPAGVLRLARGKRAVAVQDLRVEIAGRRGRLVAAVGGRRITVITFVLPAGASLKTGQASARAVPALLTRQGAVALGKRLEVALRSGRVGTLALRADLRHLSPQPVGGASSPGAAPAAGGAGPAPSSAPPIPGEPGLTVVPASREACAATPAHPALVLDLDETALSNYIDTWGDPDAGDAGQAGPAAFGQSTAMAPILDLYKKARQRGVAVFFITARPGIIEPATRDNLARVGYTAYEGLSFKNDLAAAKDAYKSAERAAVEARGYRIVLNVGDQQTDLDGGHAERAFKLPNPFY